MRVRRSASAVLCGLEHSPHHQRTTDVLSCRELRHKHVIGYIGAQVCNGEAYILTQWASGGSLRRIVKQFGSMNEAVLRSYARQTLLGLAYLHDSHVVHGDIKPGNLLLDDHGVVKICDFGTSRRVAPAPKYTPQTRKVRVCGSLTMQWYPAVVVCTCSPRPLHCADVDLRVTRGWCR